MGWADTPRRGGYSPPAPLWRHPCKQETLFLSAFTIDPTQGLFSEYCTLWMIYIEHMFRHVHDAGITNKQKIDNIRNQRKHFKLIELTRKICILRTKQGSGIAANRDFHKSLIQYCKYSKSILHVFKAPIYKGRGPGPGGHEFTPRRFEWKSWPMQKLNI